MINLYIALSNHTTAVKLQYYLQNTIGANVYIYNNQPLNYLDIVIYQPAQLNINTVDVLQWICISNANTVVNNADYHYYLSTPINFNKLLDTVQLCIKNISAIVLVNNTGFVCKLEDSKLFNLQTKTQVSNLRNKEALILHQLFYHHPQGLSKDFLLETVWGIKAQLETNTLETHIASLRKKIEPAGLCIAKNNNLFCLNTK